VGGARRRRAGHHADLHRQHGVVDFGTMFVMRRSVLTDGLAAWCEGRGGRPRRARVDECWAVLTAEGAYDSLVRDAPWKVHPGAHGQVLWTINGLAREVRRELRPNRLWRCGRAFLRCGGCDQRATRVYLPRPDTRSAACRTCLGLSYNSRQENYRDNGPLKDIGLTRRACARQQTWLSRRRSRAAARARWAARRTLWTRAGTASSRR
jgi:hypothetical protein